MRGQKYLLQSLSYFRNTIFFIFPMSWEIMLGGQRIDVLLSSDIAFPNSEDLVLQRMDQINWYGRFATVENSQHFNNISQQQ